MCTYIHSHSYFPQGFVCSQGFLDTQTKQYMCYYVCVTEVHMVYCSPVFSPEMLESIGNNKHTLNNNTNTNKHTHTHVRTYREKCTKVKEHAGSLRRVKESQQCRRKSPAIKSKLCPRYTHVYIYIYTNICICNMCMYIYIYIYIHTYVYTYICIYMCVYICIRIYIYIYIYIYNTYRYTRRTQPQRRDEQAAVVGRAVEAALMII